MYTDKLNSLLLKVETAYSRQVEICGDLYNFRKELYELIASSEINHRIGGAIHKSSDYEYIYNQRKWYVSKLINLDDFGDNVSLVEFTNCQTNESFTININSDSNLYYNFVSTNGIVGSKDVQLDQVKITSLAIYFGQITPRFIHSKKHTLIDLGKLGFVLFDTKSSTLNELSRIIPKSSSNDLTRFIPETLTVNLNSNKPRVLNSYFIESIENLTVTLGNGKEYIFADETKLIDFISSHTVKRSVKSLYRKDLSGECIIYDISYINSNEHELNIYLISVYDEIGYRNYHTWVLSKIEMMELLGKNPSIEYRKIELIEKE